jgi:hypothetical protein
LWLLFGSLYCRGPEEFRYNLLSMFNIFLSHISTIKNIFLHFFGSFLKKKISMAPFLL